MGATWFICGLMRPFQKAWSRVVEFSCGRTAVRIRTHAPLSLHTRKDFSIRTRPPLAIAIAAFPEFKDAMARSRTTAARAHHYLSFPKKAAGRKLSPVRMVRFINQFPSLLLQKNEPRKYAFPTPQGRIPPAPAMTAWFTSR